ncbi:ubiquitin carboxyl-terminal hydrolase [Rhizoctonia solani]|uniref:ubiquitinyl hydrolase 1 n=1 Tax=Rhizoctonia solani TaxID=456999 RepID=A0A8H8PAA4_9AGAM|nr:ubiquitin carboxyl-terminal hydrolase [Rhizoctonia solani]QRW26646.1 ubiquitin carboxyl-terminal hydrolase [Rhizoctonia solani]
MYLTLPLPVTKTWRHIIHWVPWDTRKRTLAVEIEVPKDSSYGYLKKLFAKWFGVEAENLRILYPPSKLPYHTSLSKRLSDSYIAFPFRLGHPPLRVAFTTVIAPHICVLFVAPCSRRLHRSLCLFHSTFGEHNVLAAELFQSIFPLFLFICSHPPAPSLHAYDPVRPPTQLARWLGPGGTPVRRTASPAPTPCVYRSGSYAHLLSPYHLLAAEVWSHKFYKFYDDYMNLTELAEKDTLVVYELPVPVKSIAKPPPQTSSFTFGAKPKPPPKTDPNAPSLLPIFHISEAQRSTAFGVPFFVLLTPAEASSREEIYRAVVERLFLSEDEDGEGEPEADEMKVEVVRDVEMQPAQEIVAKEEASTEPAQDDGKLAPPADPQGQEDFEVIGPQTELFELRLFNSVTATGIETGFNMNASSVRWVDWNTREQAAKPDPTLSDPESEDGSAVIVEKLSQPTPLVKPTDALVCQWSSPMQTHFFGSESSLFDEWEEFIHPEVQAARDAQIKSRSGRRSIDLEDCLDELTKEEQLGEEDLWYCPRCKKHQQATKRFELWSVPDILVVHLKRFSNARAMRDKIDALVEFPISGLDLSSRVGESGQSDECVYDLFAVDEHMGGLGGGHYRAYAKNLSDGEWYHFDDSYVSKSSAEDSVNANAYLLFYRRRSSDSKAVIKKVRARVDSNQEPDSQKSIDMGGQSVVRVPDEADPPPFELSDLDVLVPPSAYDLPESQASYDLPGSYRSNPGGSDDDPTFTTPSPVTTGSAGAEYDSLEEKDQDGVERLGGVAVEVTTTTTTEKKEL